MARRRLIMLVLGWAASSLTLTAAASLAAPPQAEDQRPVAPKQSSSDTKVKEMPTPKKTADDPDAEPFESSQPGFKGLGKRFLLDQEQIWTSPAKLRFSDAQWLVPLAGATTWLFQTDATYSRQLSHNPSTLSRYNNLSTASVGALIGGAGGMWLLGHVKHNEHWSETGFLAGEAALNSLVVVESLKYPLGRERPYQGNGDGPFFQGGVSFPSEHAAAAWSVAGVIAHEYPSTLTKIVVYSLASLVDVSRVRSRQHFPSDVLVGSVIGNLVAQNIYSTHHDPGLGGEAWRSFSQIFRGDGAPSPSNQGSPYVPLDSWIYPALDRLSAMGLINSGFAGLRPWTRQECLRQLNEAEEKLAGGEKNEAQKLVDALQLEFQPEIEGASQGAPGESFRLESLYSRTTYISGMPLTDGYTFAQTQINDFGRPYGEGWSTVNGFSAYATTGHLVAYVRGEEQSAPSIPAYSLATRQIVQQVDFYPMLPPGTAQPAVVQFNLLEAYVGLTFSNWEVSFGKQSLSWGPGDGGSMTLSNNAQPINMLRVSRTMPFKLPSILGWLGPIRTEFFLGQLAGQEFLLQPTGFVAGQFGQSLSPQPFIHGEKFSFKPTPNLEFGFFRTTIYGGPGFPLTFHTLFRSAFSLGNENAGAASKPGNRTAGMDLNYRLPRLRNWLTFYADGYTDDEFSPVAYADRSAWRAGLYLAQFPLVHKLDLRVEGVYTDNPLGGNLGHGFYYFNFTWLSGYTNNGTLLGSWVGREGQGAQAWSTYHFSPRSLLQLNFRHQKVSQEFIPGGGTLTDIGVRCDYQVRPSLGLSTTVQYERWLFPVIQTNTSRNVTAAVEIMFAPQKLFQRSTEMPGGRP
ncbi:MAG TPA: capsule assembly Wzi family protein [Candidatus Acidoferrum sp.]